MTIPTITALPAAPDPATDSPADFSTKAAAFVLAQKTMATELAATITAMNTEVANVDADAAAADVDAAAALVSRNQAEAFAVTAVNAPGTSGTATDSRAIPLSSAVPQSFSFTTQTGKSWSVGMTVKVVYTTSPSNWMLGTITAYNSGTGAITINVTHAQGTGTYTAWTISLAAPIMSTVANAVRVVTGATTAYKYDKGSIWHCSGTWTFGMDAAATLESGWYGYVWNTSTGTITIDPNSSETINSATTLAVHPSEVCILYCDGSAIYAWKIAGPAPYLKVSDQKANGTNGGTPTNLDITATRTLNTVDSNTISGASLASDTITLPAGTYTCRIRAPHNSSAYGAKIFLYNTSDSTYTLIGSSLYAATGGAGGDCWISGRFTITATKNFKIRYYANGATPNTGLGAAMSSGQVEVYTEAEFWKEA